MRAKRLIVLLLVVTLLSTFACGGGEEEATPTPTPTPGECSLEDIRDSEFFSLAFYEAAKRLNPTDVMPLILYVDHELSDDEIQQIEQLGVTVDEDSWITPPEGYPWGTYFAKSKVEDICKLIGIDSIFRVISLLEFKDNEAYPH